MFKLFKNASVYRINRKLENLTAHHLRLSMPDHPFTHCTSQDVSRTGWVMNEEDNTPWMLTFRNYILIKLRNERRDVPKDVINAELEKRVDDFEQRTGALPRRPEKSALRDEVFQSLLPRAFSKSSYTQILIDTDAQLIYVDAASAKVAETALAMLRKTLQSLPVFPIMSKEPPELVMTRWLKDEQPTGIECEEGRLTFQHIVSQSVKATLSGHGKCEAVTELLNANNVVTSLSLKVGTEHGLSLQLNDRLQLKRLVFSEVLKEKGREDGKDKAGEADDTETYKALVNEATFILMAQELADALNILIAALGGEAERKSTEPEAEQATA